jgi:hypothetical protein
MRYSDSTSFSKVWMIGSFPMSQRLRYIHWERERLEVPGMLRIATSLARLGPDCSWSNCSKATANSLCGLCRQSVLYPNSAADDVEGNFAHYVEVRGKKK